MKLSIIVPCYNEEEGIPNLAFKLNPILKELTNKWELELIFVDDGSSDKTNELLHQFFVRDYVKIIKHEKNKNLGASIRTGFENSTGDVVVTMDSDCTYNPNAIFPMLDMLDEETSIVTASPYHPDGGVRNVPKYRIFLSKSITKIYQILTKKDINTFTALFRVHTKDVVQNISFNSNDFLATAEHLIKSSMSGRKIKEYPLVLNVREYGTSKMRLLGVINSHLGFVKKVARWKIKGNFK
jgi:dolichol-phosphate mannosyltransferase